MSENIQSLLEKINRDGVEKAEAEAAKIIAAAKAKAADIVKAANDEAAKAKADAETAASDYSARAAETVRQAARDTILKVESSVTALLEKLLAKEVKAALANPDAVAQLVAAALKGVTGEGEVAVSAELAKALGAKLAGLGNFKVITDETLETGFSVRLDGGRVEHDFTGATIADELAKRLRPDLAKLLK